MKYLTKQILFSAADRIIGRVNGTFEGQFKDGAELYMCHAVTNAAKDAGADVAECMNEFKQVLRDLGVTTSGELHQMIDGEIVELLPGVNKSSPAGLQGWWNVAQPVRFMFLEFLALSLNK